MVVRYVLLSWEDEAIKVSYYRVKKESQVSQLVQQPSVGPGQVVQSRDVHLLPTSAPETCSKREQARLEVRQLARVHDAPPGGASPEQQRVDEPDGGLPARQRSKDLPHVQRDRLLRGRLRASRETLSGVGNALAR